MNSLDRPTVDPLVMLDECMNSVNDQAEYDHYDANVEYLEAAIADFSQMSQILQWCVLPRVPNGNNTGIVVGTLTKEQLTKLYSTYMVKSKGAARRRYDELKVAANGKCPFCGGIGHVQTLDHYVPKANFPLCSVIPSNLVPCCRDCNSGKSNAFPAVADEQTIHPYFDGDHFFSEKWVFASINQTEPMSVKFEAIPPTSWDQIDQQRAKNHFHEYKLAKRYSIEAGIEISGVVNIRRGFLKDQSAENFSTYLSERGQCTATPLNGWQRTLYTALANDEWFCGMDFMNDNQA